MGDVIDLDSPSPFIPSEWIGKGKKYDTRSLPYPVIQACTAVAAIPPAQKKTLPPDEISVNDLLKLSLPPPSSSIITLKAELWFSNDTPDKNFAYLTSRPFPPATVLDALSKAFGQAWLNGARSLIDPRYNDGHDRLPLWSISLWREMSNVVSAQSRWRKGEQWLVDESKTTASAKVMASARELLPALPWNRDAGDCVTTCEFTQLLGT